jgi:hypothetical protein
MYVLDMSQDDLTESGMKLGVEQSDVFLLVLTNRCLSRSYCLKEIGWALDANKKIICVFEDEARFWQWDFERWTRNDCTRSFSEKGEVVWKNSPSLQVNYDGCPLRIKTMITEQYKNNVMLPYRRRNFESDSLLQQIIVRSGELGCCWGQFEVRSMLRTMDTTSSVRRPLVISNLNGECFAKQLKASLVNVPGVALAKHLDESTHAVLVLSDGIFKDESLTHVMAAITTLPEDRILMVYSESAGWLFYGEEHRSAPGPIQDLLNTHEAMVYRDETRYNYEHTSMVYEIIKRLKSVQQNDSSTSTKTTTTPSVHKEESGGSSSAILKSNVNPTSRTRGPVLQNELFQASAFWEELRKLKFRVEHLELENENLKSQLHVKQNR